MVTVLESLNQGLRHALRSNEHVILLGEDILDPYGGAFKVTRGLSIEFPGRVMNTPLSEAGFTGLATGMALRGMRPVVEIMFGDFITLIADQLINHATKFRWMYNDQVRVPMVIRTPMGGRRGYGPTHSQTLEKLFLGIPGLHTYAVSTIHDPGLLLSQLILSTEDPVLFIENKLLYHHNIREGWDEFSIDSGSERLKIASLKGAPRPVLTMATYGYMGELARQAVLKLAYEEEIFVSLAIFEQLAPFDIQPLIPVLSQNGKLLVIEEGTGTLGWGAEIIASINETNATLISACSRVCARATPIPASKPIEELTLPGINTIFNTALRLIKG